MGCDRMIETRGPRGQNVRCCGVLVLLLLSACSGPPATQPVHPMGSSGANASPPATPMVSQSSGNAAPQPMVPPIGGRGPPPIGGRGLENPPAPIGGRASRGRASLTDSGRPLNG